MTARSAWIRPATLRILALVAVLALIASACGGGAEEPASDVTNTTETAAGDTTSGADPTALPDPTATAAPEPTAIPDPTATAVPTPAPAAAASDDEGDSADDGGDLSAGDAASRELAIDELMSGEDAEDIDRATAECMVDAVYDTVGTYAPTEEQEFEALGAAMLCFFSSAMTPELLTEAAIEEGHPRPTAECLGTRISAMFSDLDIESEDMSADEEIALVEEMNSCGDPLGAATGDAAPGTNAEFDDLWVGCSDGVAQDCLSLENVTLFDDELKDYQLFALSCGGRVIVEIDCGLWIDGESLVSDTGLVASPETGSAPPGTDAALDALWELCTAEDAQACNDLYFDSPVGSAYEAYGYSCGGRDEAGGSCSDLLGGGEPADFGFDLDAIPDPGSPPPGTDAVLDALWEDCGAGSAGACDNLYFDSPLDSVYEAYGFTCGGRTPNEDCTDLLGPG